MKKYSLSYFLFFTFILLLGCSAKDEIIIQDPQLSQVIYETLELDETEVLTKSALNDLKELDASFRGITNLAGIEAAQKLTTLHLQGNNIENIEPLLTLTRLERVNLKGNPVSQTENSEVLSLIFQLEENGVFIDYIHNPPYGIFYKINHGNSTVYLFGSIHIGSEELYPLHNKVELAFMEADHLAVEIDLTNEEELKLLEMMLGIGIYKDGGSLQLTLNDDHAFEKIVELLAPQGYHEPIINQFKPFIVEELIKTTAGEEAGFTFDYGVDNYFLNRADGVKNIISLETVEEQLTLYDILSEETQVELLLSTIENYDGLADDLTELMNYWVEGDKSALTKLRSDVEIDSEDYLTYMKALTDDRDIQMANTIEDFLLSDHGETYFIVVGALHLVGENSITGLLAERGYLVEDGYAEAD